jgi:hypothetical protein
VRPERGVKARHQGDLVWRFQRAGEGVVAHGPSALAVLAGNGSGTSVAEARLGARERIERIDAALGRLRTRPVRLARVLFLRYGAVGAPPETRAILRENAAVATITPAAARWCTRIQGEPPRPRSHDVRRWLGAMCRRIAAREATGADTVAIAIVRRAAERLLAEAEAAYVAATEARRAR